MNDETLARLTAARKQLRLIDEDGATTHGTRFLIERLDRLIEIEKKMKNVYEWLENNCTVNEYQLENQANEIRHILQYGERYVTVIHLRGRAMWSWGKVDYNGLINKRDGYQGKVKNAPMLALYAMISFDPAGGRRKHFGMHTLYERYTCKDCDRRCVMSCIDEPQKCVHTGRKVDWEGDD